MMSHIQGCIDLNCVSNRCQEVPEVMSDAPEKPSSNIAVLHKALDLLETLQSSDKPRSLDQLVAATGLARSTVHRLLLNLVARGYVERAEASSFALGLKLLEL